MREPWQWQEEDIEALIREQRKEDLRLEYKRSDALARTDGKKTEIAKDVSAMANSAGGVILYGVDEQRRSNGPIQLDSGIDAGQISTEWLEQVVDSGIQQRIDGVRVTPVRMASTGKLVYVVWIPQSNRAPHMASDHRYYKRLGTTTAPMEEYEVRDVGHRSESPDLSLHLKTHKSPGVAALELSISNQAPEPALYATCRLYVDQELTVELSPNTSWSKLNDAELLWNERDNVRFKTLLYRWSIPSSHPILEGEQYPLGIILHVKANFEQGPEVQRYRIGWEVRTPKAMPKLQGLYLVKDQNGPRIEAHTYKLARL